MTDSPKPRGEGPIDDRYLSYEDGDGYLVLYDGENDRAWVRSDTTADLRR